MGHKQSAKVEAVWRSRLVKFGRSGKSDGTFVRQAQD